MSLLSTYFIVSNANKLFPFVFFKETRSSVDQNFQELKSLVNENQLKFPNEVKYMKCN